MSSGAAAASAMAPSARAAASRTGQSASCSSGSSCPIADVLPGAPSFNAARRRVSASLDFSWNDVNRPTDGSLPAQVYAQKIGCYKTTGTVSELTESGFLLTTETDVVQVNADAALLDGLENGMTVTVYSNGAMTMSLPGQIGAEKIVKAE